MQHPAGLDAADVPRDPGLHAPSLRCSNVRHDGAVPAHCGHRSTFGQLSGSPDPRDVIADRRGNPGDDVDDVIAGVSLAR